MYYRVVLMLYFQIASIWTAPIVPLKIIQAQPQVMMHTLQQPPPIDTLQSLKAQKLHQNLQVSTKLQQMMMANLQQQMTTNTLQELAKIQAMQYAAPGHVEMHPPELMQAWLPHIPTQNIPQTNMPWQQIPEEQQQPEMPMIQQMTEDAMQEIVLQQQMLALQQMQAFSQFSTANSPYTFPQPEPVLILLPDEKTEDAQGNLLKNTNANKNAEHADDDSESVVVESPNEIEPEAPKTRKAILLIPNARISIGGIISTIPWLPIEINVPDTAIWAWNGIYNGISSIISIIGSRLPWRPKPQETSTSSTIEPSVKMFLKQLQRNDYGQFVPVYPMPLDAEIPVHFP